MANERPSTLDDRLPPSRWRPRPVAELPLESLLERSDELARRWAADLILGRRLDSLGEVPLEQIGAQAPALCEQLVRSLGSEEELDRLLGTEAGAGRQPSPSYPERAAALAGARDAATIVAGVEALREAAWQMALQYVDGPADPVRARGLTDM